MKNTIEKSYHIKLATFDVNTFTTMVSHQAL